MQADDTSTFMKLVHGAGAGLAATGAMSAVIGAADKVGLIKEEPPRLIVADLLPVEPKSTLNNALAVVAHVGYGTGMGAVYGLVPSRWGTKTPVGVGYGALIWALGYEGWLPLMGILPPAQDDDRGRAVTMFVAHLVYGGALARARR